jgi:hypothetical protein
MRLSLVLSLTVMMLASAPVRADEGIGVTQAVLSPTGFTQPAGSLAVNSYELAGLGMTFAPLDRWQVSATGVFVPGTTHLLDVLHLATKVRVLDHGPLHLALVGSSTWGYAQYVTTRLDGGGLVASLCLRPECGWVVSTFATGFSYRTSGSVDDGGEARSLSLAYGASAIGGLSPHWRLLLEVAGAGQVGCNIHCSDELVSRIAASVGARLQWRSLVADLAIVSVLQEDPLEVTPLPWLAVSYRAL